jgi:hypothetical protein
MKPGPRLGGAELGQLRECEAAGAVERGAGPAVAQRPPDLAGEGAERDGEAGRVAAPPEARPRRWP